MNYVLTFLTLLKELRNDPKNPRLNLPMLLLTPLLLTPLMPHQPHKSVLSVRYPGRMYFLDLFNLGSLGNCGCGRNRGKNILLFPYELSLLCVSWSLFYSKSCPRMMITIMMFVDLCMSIFTCKAYA